MSASSSSTFCRVTVYIIAKNEEANIGKCLRYLREYAARVVLLDSGSVDRTCEIAALYAGVHIERYNYVSHAETYNYVTESLTPDGEWAVIIDADMEIQQELWDELSRVIGQDIYCAIAAPIRMCVEGAALNSGSLCPPKLFAFRGGRAYFRPHGHGERLLEGVSRGLLRFPIVHNDLKPYERYLESQVRYARNVWTRSKSGQLSAFDRLSLWVPIKAYVAPSVSLIVRLGLLAGARGLIYALDRHIAGLVQYRQILAHRLADSDCDTAQK